MKDVKIEICDQFTKPDKQIFDVMRYKQLEIDISAKNKNNRKYML